jgi:hypothetical protein
VPRTVIYVTVSFDLSSRADVADGNVTIASINTHFIYN